MLFFLLFASQVFAQSSGFENYHSGSQSDLNTNSNFGLMLMGGGVEVDEPFRWFTQKANGGDLVILRASGRDEYNELFSKFEKLNSIETFVFKNRSAASNNYVLDKIKKAEVIFISGGDQSKYLEFWSGTPLTSEISKRLKQKNLVLGGTSAGLAIMGEQIYSAEEGTIYSEEALSNPFDKRNTLQVGFLNIPYLDSIITDSHFTNRDRMGRLMSWLARLYQPKKFYFGLGVDESTFLLVDDAGNATVDGLGAVYFLTPTRKPIQCTPNEALVFESIHVNKFKKGDKVDLKSSQFWGGVQYSISAEKGMITSSQAGGAVY